MTTILNRNDNPFEQKWQPFWTETTTILNRNDNHLSIGENWMNLLPNGRDLYMSPIEASRSAQIYCYNSFGTCSQDFEQWIRISSLIRIVQIFYFTSIEKHVLTIYILMSIGSASWELHQYSRRKCGQRKFQSWRPLPGIGLGISWLRGRRSTSRPRTPHVS